ncbi:MAG: hypothetical protein GF350_05870 [Chitinivibrionales bacterium]|nr:hypothetical protein [Chitinivibrionales bacterium]
MNSMEPSNQAPPGELSRREAELLAIAFNVLFNSANFYGPKHPTTQKNASDLFTQLKKAFSSVPVITLSRQHDSLYMEKYCVDSKLKADRIIATFKKTGLESLSFEEGITGKDIREFIQIFSRSDTYGSVDEMSADLAKRSITGIRLNYIMYRQVKADENIVNSTEIDGQSSAGMDKEEAFQNQALDKIGTLFSMNELIDQPAHIAEDILSVVVDGNDQAQSQIVGRIREMNYQVQEIGTQNRQAVSIDEMMEAVCEMKMQLREGLELQRTMGRIVKTKMPVLEEVDQLTYEVIVKLVREEFRKGQISVMRLAQVIKRMLPDINELKRLLPRLKSGLLEEGMSLPDFLQLVQELSRELQNDSITHIISENAEEFGISSEEVVQAIKRDPKEAIRLIMLGSEIKKNAGSTDEELSFLLASYIENASSKMALESHEAQGRPGGVRALEQIIHTVEKQLITRLQSEGVSDSVIKGVEKKLTERFTNALSVLKSNWIVDLVAKGEENATSYLMQIVDTIVDQEIELDSINHPLREALSQKGYSPAQTEEFIGKIAERVSNRKTMKPLPKGILSTNTLLYFLQREIKCHLRYESTFSTLMITLRSIKYENEWKAIKNKEQLEIIPQIFSAVKSLLRDLDLVGSIGTTSKEIPLIVLPMTDEPGAKTVRRRITRKLQENTITVGGQTVGIRVVISINSSQDVTGPDVMEYLQKVKIRHGAAEEQASQG